MILNIRDSMVKSKMKIIIIYFSLGGRTKRVAEKIAFNLNSSYVTLENLNYLKRKRNYFIEQEKIFNGDLSNFKFDKSIFDLRPYELIIFGTPTHGTNPTAAFYGYLEHVRNIKGKKFILFNTCRAIPGQSLTIMESEIEKREGKVVKKQFFMSLFKIRTRQIELFSNEIYSEIINLKNVEENELSYLTPISS